MALLRGFARRPYPVASPWGLSPILLHPEPPLWISQDQALICLMICPMLPIAQARILHRPGDRLFIYDSI